MQLWRFLAGASPGAAAYERCRYIPKFWPWATKEGAFE